MLEHYDDDERGALRRDLLRRRRALSEEEAAKAGRAVLNTLLSHSFMTSPRLVASYASLRGEVGTAEINRTLLTLGHTLCLPVVDPDGAGVMRFHRTDKGSVFTEDRYGIREPLPSMDTLVEDQSIDVVLLPLVGFDAQGNRLGMGGGYYDRLLKRLSSRTLLIGIAYDFQEVRSINAKEWDMPVDEVITPTRHLVFRKKL